MASPLVASAARVGRVGPRLYIRRVAAVRATRDQPSALSTATSPSFTPTNTSSIVPGVTPRGRQGASWVHGAHTSAPTITVATSTPSGCSDSRTSAPVGYQPRTRIERHHTSAMNGATTQRSQRLAQSSARNSQLTSDQSRRAMNQALISPL